MARAVNVYVKKRLRLDLLNIPQRRLYALGVVGLESIKKRTREARGADDAAAAPLKSESWKRIKKAKGLKPIRDLRGTGMAWPGKGGKRKPKLKKVGHLMDQLLVRKVSDTRVHILEPSTRMGRIKARAHKAMLLFSPKDKAAIIASARKLLIQVKNRVIRTR